jgi:hypothetical protein
MPRIHILKAVKQEAFVSPPVYRGYRNPLRTLRAPNYTFDFGNY